MATAKPAKGAVFSVFEKRKKDRSSTPDPLPMVINARDGVSKGAEDAVESRKDVVKSGVNPSTSRAQMVFSIFKKPDKSKLDVQAAPAVALDAPAPTTAQSDSPAPVARVPGVQVIDLASRRPAPVAPLFMTKAMKEQQRIKENEESLQKAKEKSKSLEKALFGGALSSNGKSLNAVLMERSAICRSPSFDSDVDTEQSQSQNKKIVFQEATQFPMWQHVNLDNDFLVSSAIDWSRGVSINGVQVSASNDETWSLSKSSSHTCDISPFDSADSEVKIIDLCASPPSRARDPELAHEESRAPIYPAPADLRALWVNYMTDSFSYTDSKSSSPAVIDLSLTTGIDGSTKTDLLHYFRPRSSKDICGNKKSIRQFKRWLQEWRLIEEKRNKRRLATAKSKGSSQKPKKLVRREDDYLSDINSDFSDGEADEFSTIFILQGPSGCGKTSAVYACAEELGFEVKEENTSECRAGNAIKRRVHETSQSRSFGSSSSGVSAGGIFGGASPGDAIPLERSSSKDMHKTKLILFDEADIVFDDDAGMYRAIIQLSKETKCPIVLTTQRNLLLEPKTGLTSSKPPPTVAEMDFPSIDEASEFLQIMVSTISSSSILSTVPSKRDIDVLCELCRCDIRQCILTMQLLVGAPGSKHVAKSKGFFAWLREHHGEQVPWMDFVSVSNCLGTPCGVLKPLSASGSRKLALQPPALLRVEPSVLDPADPLKLIHLHGHNFLQRKLPNTSSDNDGKDHLPLYMWMCGERFECDIIDDTLAVLHLSFKEGKSLSGSHEIYLQLGDSLTSNHAINSLEFVIGVVPVFDDVSPLINPSCVSKRLFLCVGSPNRLHVPGPMGKPKKCALALLQPVIPRRSSSGASTQTVSVLASQPSQQENSSLFEVSPLSNAPPVVPAKRTRRQVLNDDDNESASKPVETEVDSTPSVVSDGGVQVSSVPNGQCEENWGNETVGGVNLEAQKAFLLNILDKVSSDPESYPFLEPVDVSIYSDYRLYVKHPMDLDTVRQSVVEGVYNICKHGGLKKLRRRKTDSQNKSLDEAIDVASFISDVRLIWSNCEMYNELNSEIVLISRRLSNLFEDSLEEHRAVLMRLFSYDYFPPPHRQRKSKFAEPKVQAVKVEQKLKTKETTEDSDFEGISELAPRKPSAELPNKLSDSSSDEGEWSDESESISAKPESEAVATRMLPPVEVPSKEAINILLDSADQAREQRDIEVTKWTITAASLCADPGLASLLPIGISKPPCESPDSGLDELSNLSSLADVWSDVDLLQSAFDDYCPCGDSLFTTSFQNLGVECIDEFPLDDDLESQMTDKEKPISESIATSECGSLFGGGKSHSRYDLIGPKMFLEDSVWNASATNTHRFRRLACATNESNNIFVSARPFSTVEWNRGWSGVQDVVFEIKKLAMNNQRISIADDGGEYKYWSLMKGRSTLVAWIHQNYPLGTSVSQFYYSSVFSNRTNRWSLSRELILDGLPMLRTMLSAESSPDDKGGNQVTASAGTRRSSRRMASSMRFHHLALSTGRSEPVLAELMDVGRCRVKKM